MKMKTKNGEKSRLVLLRNDLRTNKSLYLLFLPVILYYIIFLYGPMYGALIAFQDYSPRLGFLHSPWVGFKHFKAFFTSPSFYSVVRNTINISFTSLVFGFPAPIIFAILLNELKSNRFSKVVQNATYLPHFISLVVICGMVKIFTRDTGIITYIMSLFGCERRTLLNYPEYFVPIYVSTTIWQNLGWNSIIYLAALTGVDESQYEAATIDGANRFQQLIHVTLPGISLTIVTMFVLKIGSLMSVGYEQILLLYNDATLDVADVISTYVYRKGLIEHNWSFSTAVNMFNSVLNIILLYAANTLSRKLTDSGLW